MKVIDLLNKIDKAETMPKEIKVDGKIYTWSFEHFYYDEDGEDLLDLSRKYNTPKFLSMDVEVIEENQDIDIQSIEELDVQENQFNTYNKTVKINELIQAIKQLDRQINNN